MLSLPVLRQDLMINKKRILVMFALQLISMLLAIGICEMKLIEISDVFWDTIPVIVIPMVTEMLLAYEVLTKRTEDGTTEILLAAGVRRDVLYRTKLAFVTGTGLFFLLFCTVMGCLTRAYSLTGEWTQRSYILLNVGAGCLQFLISAFCCWCAGRAKEWKLYARLGALIPAVMYLIYLLFYWYDALFFLQYVTVFSLYRQSWFCREDMMAYIGSGCLLVLGLLFTLVGKRAFGRLLFGQAPKRG